MKKDIDTLFELSESEGEKPVGGELELNVVEAKEGTLIRLSDGLVVDPEVLLSMFESVSKFEEEFGSIDEAAEKLRLLRRIEENLAPLEELEETVNRLVESAEELLSSYSKNEQNESLGDYYDDRDEAGGFGLEDEEDEDDEDEEEIDVSDLTVKELLILLLQMLSTDDDSEEEADLDVDFSDLDLARLGNMKVSDLVSALKEGKLSKTLEGCGCGEKKYEGTSVDSLFEVDEDTEVLGMGPETANLMRGEGGEASQDRKQHGEKEEEVEGEDEEMKKAEESFESEDFGAQLFKRLLERLEK